MVESVSEVVPGPSPAGWRKNPELWTASHRPGLMVMRPKSSRRGTSRPSATEIPQEAGRAGSCEVLADVVSSNEVGREGDSTAGHRSRSMYVSSRAHSWRQMNEPGVKTEQPWALRWTRGDEKRRSSRGKGR